MSRRKVIRVPHLITTQIMKTVWQLSLDESERSTSERQSLMFNKKTFLKKKLKTLGFTSLGTLAKSVILMNLF